MKLLVILFLIKLYARKNIFKIICIIYLIIKIILYGWFCFCNCLSSLPPVDRPSIPHPHPWTRMLPCLQRKRLYPLDSLAVRSKVTNVITK